MGSQNIVFCVWLHSLSMFPGCIHVVGWTRTSFLFFKGFYLFTFKERGREGERDRNINVWLPLACPLLGTWPTIQACALTGNWTGDPLVLRPALNPRSHTTQGRTSFLFMAEKELHCVAIVYLVYPSSVNGHHVVSTFWPVWTVLLWALTCVSGAAWTLTCQPFAWRQVSIFLGSCRYCVLKCYLSWLNK